MTEPQSKYRRRFFPLLAAAILIILLATVVWWNHARLARAAEGETLVYNHRVHIAAGAQCVYCHPGVLYGRVAGLPSTAKCIGCHASVEVRPEAQETVDVLLQHWEEGQPLRWVKTFDQPDFVYFGHRPHIAAGVACETCHGNVAEMARVEQTIRLNMGFCLTCHRAQAPEKVKRLEACSTCHQ
jgi:hypothetical protein